MVEALIATLLKSFRSILREICQLNLHISIIIDRFLLIRPAKAGTPTEYSRLLKSCIYVVSMPELQPF